jgi:uncharacterized membrane protein
VQSILNLWPFNTLRRRYFVSGVLILLALLVGTIGLIHLSPYSNTVPKGVGNYYQYQEDQLKYVRARVLKVDNLAPNQNSDNNQQIKVKILDGPDKGQVVSVSRNDNFGDAAYRRMPVGSEVLLSVDSSTGRQYIYYQDRYRIPGAITLFLLLLVLVILIGRWRGIGSMVGLAISIAVLSVFVLPRILAGKAAFATCIEGALIIAVLSIYTAHGFNKRTTIALSSTLIALLLTAGLSVFAVYLTGVTGFLGESSIPIQYAPHAISFSGLLLGSVVIASLGILNDITTGQAAAVDEIYKANRKQHFTALYRGGLSVGREHIAALVNTLALVYVGVSLPVIVTTVLENHAPLLVVFNSEAVMEDVVRTGVSSIGLLLAVPITTALAAYFLPIWYTHDTGRRSLLKSYYVATFGKVFKH